MTYDDVLREAYNAGLIVKEKPLTGSDGRIYNNRVAIRRNIPTSVEKSCVLAEEIGHYHTSYGDITRLKNDSDKKQEYRARLYGYNLRIGLIGIIQAFKAGCRNLYEMAEYLDVTEEYLKEAIECYRSKYGSYMKFDNYIIYFVPCLVVSKINGGVLQIEEE